MNAPFRASKSAAEILQDCRITTSSSTVGRQYVVCPQCSHKRKPANQKVKCLGVTIDHDGVKAGCNHCGWTGGGFYRGPDRPYTAHVLPLPTPSTTPEPSELARMAQAVRMWDGGRDPVGTLAERYLNSRRLDLSDDIASRVVRFDGASPWKNANDEIEHRPVMLLAFRSIANDKLVAVHRTLLSDDGQKLDRRMLGPTAGAAIKIDADIDVEQGLHIGEGFETCLAGRALGYPPVWALGSAGAIGRFPVLSGINALTILGETDDSGDNIANAKACARRWTDAGQEVWLLQPSIAGDMNDVVMKS